MLDDRDSGERLRNAIDCILDTVVQNVEVSAGSLRSRRLRPPVWLARLSGLLGAGGAIAEQVAVDSELAVGDPESGLSSQARYCDLLVRVAVEATVASTAFIIPEDPGAWDPAVELDASVDLLQDMVEEKTSELDGPVSLERWHVWLIKDLGHAAETLTLIERAVSDDQEAIDMLLRRGKVPAGESPVFGAQGVVGMDCLVLAMHAVLAAATLAPDGYEPVMADLPLD